LKYHCVQCKVGLCVYPCFHDYHTKLNLWTVVDMEASVTKCGFLLKARA
jgi:hypothetical protein